MIQSIIIIDVNKVKKGMCGVPPWSNAYGGSKGAFHWACRGVGGLFLPVHRLKAHSLFLLLKLRMIQSIVFILIQGKGMCPVSAILCF